MQKNHFLEILQFFKSYSSRLTYKSYQVFQKEALISHTFLISLGFSMTTEIKTDTAIKSTINKQVRKRCQNPINRQQDQN